MNSTKILSVNQEMLVLSLVINWKSKRAHVEPKKLACRAFAPLLIPNSRLFRESIPLTYFQQWRLFCTPQAASRALR